MILIYSELSAYLMLVYYITLLHMYTTYAYSSAEVFLLNKGRKMYFNFIYLQILNIKYCTLCYKCYDKKYS